MRRQNFQSYGGSFAWGGVVLFVGVVLLLDHMGVISAAGLWRFWPMILVLAGIVALPTRRSFAGRVLIDRARGAFLPPIAFFARPRRGQPADHQSLPQERR